ncbi:hypothetical protein MMC16_007796 [Acarospora aff. strigata]|nr:hypothetical protein [Acarospora aff. strigata]
MSAMKGSFSNVIDLTVEDDSDGVVDTTPRTRLSGLPHNRYASAGSASTRHETREKTARHTLEGSRSNDKLGDRRHHNMPRNQRLGKKAMKNPVRSPKGLGIDTHREIVSKPPSDRKVQGLSDLSLFGPGESKTETRKRTRDGRFKASSPSNTSTHQDTRTSSCEEEVHHTSLVKFTKASGQAIRRSKSTQEKGSLRHAERSKQTTTNRDTYSCSSEDPHMRTHPTTPKPLAPYYTSPPTSSLLRWREMGFGGIRGASDQLNIRSSHWLKPWKYWTGASNDVIVLSWSPDGLSYAVGASAQTDESSMQYNRPNNLLYGSLLKDTIWELPEHRIDRPLPASGPNTNQAIYDACDPDLYMSVTSVCFSASGHKMYSASYDETVKVWDTSSHGRLHNSDTLVHDAKVEVMAISGQYDEHLATGSQVLDGAVRIYTLSKDGTSVEYTTLSSPRARKSPALELYPSCLRWGTSSWTQHLLLAGFSSKDRDDHNNPGKEGDLYLWDLNRNSRIEVLPNAQNVFDLAWHPILPRFAVGSIPRPGNIGDRSSRSAVRVYDLFSGRGSRWEFESPALDINDVSFSPTGPNYVAAGCTNGITYVWDERKPDTPVHKLEHGRPIAPIKPYMTREQSDTGVRFAAWVESDQFYTGSSDGLVKSWNVKLAPENVHVRDVAQFEAGVMCGAFSPDSTNLLVGDGQGSIHILSTAPVTPYESDEEKMEKIKFQHAEERHGPSGGSVIDDSTAAAQAAQSLITSGELVIHPLWGAGKGPNYKGPYASYVRKEGADPHVDQLLPHYQAQQLHPAQRALAEQAGFMAGPAERRFITVQQELARARNLRVVQSQLPKKAYPRGEINCSASH